MKSVLPVDWQSKASDFGWEDVSNELREKLEFRKECPDGAFLRTNELAADISKRLIYMKVQSYDGEYNLGLDLFGQVRKEKGTRPSQLVR